MISDATFEVKVEHGLVTLTGKADWNYQKQVAARAAGRINGVKGVLIAPRPSTHDVRERITSAFKRSSTLDSNAIDIKVDGSTVKLSGRLHGWNERKVAENAAWSAPGVTRVEDNIVLA